MGLMDGGLAEVFAGAFGALYLDGQLYRPAAFTDDGAGGGSDNAFGEPEAVKVQIDAATYAMQHSEGFVEGDMRILVLAHGVSTIDTDCEIQAGGTRWLIETVATDPAGTYYELRGRRKSSA